MSGPKAVGLLCKTKSLPTHHQQPLPTHTHTHSYFHWLIASPQASFPPTRAPIFPELSLHDHSIELLHDSLSKTLLLQSQGATGRWRPGFTRPLCRILVSLYLEDRGSVPWSFLTRSSLLLRSTSLIFPRELLLCRVPLPSWWRGTGNKLRGCHADWLLSLLLTFILHAHTLPAKPSD